MSKRKEKQTHEFLRGSTILAYDHVSKQSELEDFIIQAFKASNVYNWLQGVNEPLQQRDYLSISSLKCLTHSNTHKFMRK